MPAFPNFYERLDEAKMRLLKTVVMYDGEPYHVLAIDDHKKDGIFRIYLDWMGRGQIAQYCFGDFPRYWDYSSPGEKLDEWIANNPDSGVLRRYMGASGFNKYRPFPLGNMNYDGSVLYLERTPTRNTTQGLRRDSIVAMPVSVSPDVLNTAKRSFYDAYTEGYGVSIELEANMWLYDCIKGNYPTFSEVIEALQDPEVTNIGVAFHREFSVFRGPLNMLFLCYQHQGVGVVTKNNMCFLTLSSEYEFLKEQIQELGVFDTITVSQK